MPKMKVTGKKDDYSSTRLPIIKCVCGAEILIVPDVKFMANAVEAHVETHKKELKDNGKMELEAEKIRDFLIVQVLQKASES